MRRIKFTEKVAMTVRGEFFNALTASFWRACGKCLSR